MSSQVDALDRLERDISFFESVIFMDKGYTPETVMARIIEAREGIAAARKQIKEQDTEIQRLTEKLRKVEIHREDEKLRRLAVEREVRRLTEGLRHPRALEVAALELADAAEKVDEGVMSNGLAQKRDALRYHVGAVRQMVKSGRKRRSALLAGSEAAKMPLEPDPVHWKPLSPDAAPVDDPFRLLGDSEPDGGGAK